MKVILATLIAGGIAIISSLLTLWIQHKQENKRLTIQNEYKKEEEIRQRNLDVFIEILTLNQRVGDILNLTRHIFQNAPESTEKSLQLKQTYKDFQIYFFRLQELHQTISVISPQNIVNLSSALARSIGRYGSKPMIEPNGSFDVKRAELFWKEYNGFSLALVQEIRKYTVGEEDAILLPGPAEE